MPHLAAGERNGDASEKGQFGAMNKSSFRIVLLALNGALGIVVVTWLHAPPFGYEPLASRLTVPNQAIVADWIRTAVMAAGFLLAVIAYLTWRRPDDARRRADSAQEIVRHSRKLETAALGARLGTLTVRAGNGPVSLEIKMAEAKSVARDLSKAKERAALQQALDEFRSYRAEADEWFRGSRAAELMDAVATAGQQIVQAYSTVEYLDDAHRQTLGDIRFKRVLEKTLDALGVRFHLEDELDAANGDRFKAELQRDCDALRQVLLAFLVAR